MGSGSPRPSTSASASAAATAAGPSASAPKPGRRGRERKRLNSYAAQACERCRGRKQRCLREDEDDICKRNCSNAGTACVYAPKDEGEGEGEGEPSRGGSHGVQDQDARGSSPLDALTLDPTLRDHSGDLSGHYAPPPRLFSHSHSPPDRSDGRGKTSPVLGYPHVDGHAHRSGAQMDLAGSGSGADQWAAHYQETDIDGRQSGASGVGYSAGADKVYAARMPDGGGPFDWSAILGVVPDPIPNPNSNLVQLPMGISAAAGGTGEGSSSLPPRGAVKQHNHTAPTILPSLSASVASAAAGFHVSQAQWNGASQPHRGRENGNGHGHGHGHGHGYGHAQGSNANALYHPHPPSYSHPHVRSHTNPTPHTHSHSHAHAHVHAPGNTSSHTTPSSPVSAHTHTTHTHSNTHAGGTRFDTASAIAMVSLEAAAEPHYIGESSGSLWSTIVGKSLSANATDFEERGRGDGDAHAHAHAGGQTAVQGARSRGASVGVGGRGGRGDLAREGEEGGEEGEGGGEGAAGGRAGDRSRRRNRSSRRSPSPADHEAILAGLQQAIPEKVADRVLEAVYRHLQPRYPFMDWQRFDEQWRARDGLLLALALGRPLNKEAGVAAFFVLMVLAIGAQLCKNERLPGLLRAEEYYAVACRQLPLIVQLHNLANIQGLLLLAMYSLRDSRGPSIWYLSGTCIRLCCGLGLHRSPSARILGSMSPYDVRMRKRVFWTSYLLDRNMSLTLGRPPGISDDDIDVDLPDPDVIDELDVSLPLMRTQSLASAVHYFRLKRIESRIQRSIYSVARRGQSTVDDTWKLLGEIDAWEGEIPHQAAGPGAGTAAAAQDAIPSCSRDWFVLRGAEARLHLLRPICTDLSDEARPFIPLLAQHAARGCELQKRTHHLGQPGSSTSAHSTFICGLALLYAIFLQPEALGLRQVFGAISAASGTLFAYAQSDTTLAALHDVFEELAAVLIERISTGRSAAATVVAPGANVTSDESEQSDEVMAPASAAVPVAAEGAAAAGNERVPSSAPYKVSASLIRPVSDTRAAPPAYAQLPAPQYLPSQAQSQSQQQSHAQAQAGSQTHTQTMQQQQPQQQQQRQQQQGQDQVRANSYTGPQHDGGPSLSVAYDATLEMPTPGAGEVADGWQRAFGEATNNMDSAVVNDYVDLLQSLGIQMPDADNAQDSLWDLAIFSGPGGDGS